MLLTNANAIDSTTHSCLGNRKDGLPIDASKF
jgi:hypothetical protein